MRELNCSDMLLGATLGLTVGGFVLTSIPNYCLPSDRDSSYNVVTGLVNAVEDPNLLEMGAVNYADNLEGSVQIGMLNMAKDLHQALQIGVINAGHENYIGSSCSGIQLGVLNSRNGFGNKKMERRENNRRYFFPPCPPNEGLDFFQGSLVFNQIDYSDADGEEVLQIGLFNFAETSGHERDRFRPFFQYLTKEANTK